MTGVPPISQLDAVKAAVLPLVYDGGQGSLLEAEVDDLAEKIAAAALKALHTCQRQSRDTLAQLLWDATRAQDPKDFMPTVMTDMGSCLHVADVLIERGVTTPTEETPE